jgi:hypothetical protein
MTSGRVERVRQDEVKLYDEHGSWLEYFSGNALRSWCVIGQTGMAREDWKSINIINAELFAAFAIRQHAIVETLD